MAASPEIDQLLDLFEDRSEAELQTILSRHGGNLDETVAAILSGERAVGALTDNAGTSPTAGRIQQHDEGIPGCVLPPKKNANGQSDGNNNRALHGWPNKAEPSGKGATGFGQFGALSSSRARRSSRRPGTEEATNSGSMPVPLRVSSSTVSSHTSRAITGAGTRTNHGTVPFIRGINRSLATKTELQQLMDLFEDLSKTELQTILSRHGGNLDNAVAAICDGERAVGALSESRGDLTLSDKKQYDEEGDHPLYAPWSAVGSHERTVLNRVRVVGSPSSEKRMSTMKLKTSRSTSQGGVRQFGAQSLSCSSSSSRHQRMMEEQEAGGGGTMPVSMASHVPSSSTISSPRTSRRSRIARRMSNNGTIGGISTSSTSHAGGTNSTAAPVGAGGDEMPAASVDGTAGDGAAAITSLLEGETTVVAEAVTRDYLVDSVREELRSELQQQLQALGASVVASAEVIAVERTGGGEERTVAGTSRGMTSNRSELKRPWHKSKWLWIAGIMVVFAIIGGLVGAIVGMSGDGGGSNSSGENDNLEDGVEQGPGTTNTPTLVPEDAPTDPPFNSAPPPPSPLFPPTPLPTQTPSPLPTQSPSPLPTRGPTPFPTRSPTRNPTRRPTPVAPPPSPVTPCTDRYGSNIEVCEERSSECTFYVVLSFDTCSSYCSARGGVCFAAQADSDHDCRSSGSNSCNGEFNDNICTCSLGNNNNGGGGGSSPTCTERYGSGIIVCSEGSSQCKFYVDLNDQSCDDYCNNRGGSCLSARNDADGDCQEIPDSSHSCSADRSDTICTCTL